MQNQRPIRMPAENTTRVQFTMEGCPIMIDGLQGPFHVEQHMRKLALFPYDAGIDLYPNTVPPEVTTYEKTSWSKIIIHTGVTMVLPPGWVGLVTERSSTVDKLQGAKVIPSKIDTGYTGELIIRVVCFLPDLASTLELINDAVASKVALAQMTAIHYGAPIFAQLDDKAPYLQRGKNGYGSTDHSKPLIIS